MCLVKCLKPKHILQCTQYTSLSLSSIHISHYPPDISKISDFSQDGISVNAPLLQVGLGCPTSVKGLGQSTITVVPWVTFASGVTIACGTRRAGQSKGERKGDTKLCVILLVIRQCTFNITTNDFWREVCRFTRCKLSTALHDQYILYMFNYYS